MQQNTKVRIIFKSLEVRREDKLEGLTGGCRGKHVDLDGCGYIVDEGELLETGGDGGLGGVDDEVGDFEAIVSLL